MCTPARRLRRWRISCSEAPDRREPVAVHFDALAAVHDSLHRPALHRRLDDPRQLGLVPLEKGERAIRKHHPEAVGRAHGVLLESGDIPRGEAALDEQGEKQAGGPGADYRDAHVMPVSYITRTVRIPYDCVIVHEPPVPGLVQPHCEA
jgi:hypothetical protein